MDQRRVAPTEHADASLSVPILVEDVSLIPAWSKPANEAKVRIGLLALLSLIFLPNLGAFGHYPI